MSFASDWRIGWTLPGLLGATLLWGCDSATPSSARLGGVYLPVRVATDRANVDLTGVTALDVDSRGNILAGDVSAQVMVFSAEGAFLRRMGRRGQGPGEFEGIQSVRVLPGDSVFAFDGRLQRATVFGPGSDRAAYSVNLGANSMLFSYWTAPLPSARSIVAAYRAAFGDGDGRGEHGHRLEVLRILNPDGSIRQDSVLASPEAEMLFFRGPMKGVTYNPFGREMVYAVGDDDRVYAAWNGALEIGVYSAVGKPIKTIHVTRSYQPRRITDHDRDSLVQALSGTIPAAQVRRAFADIGSDSWPLFREMVIDDTQNVWLGLLGKHGEPVHWTAFDQNGAQVASMDLPENVSLRVVRGRKAYGVELDQDDVPRVVVYELRPASAGPAPPARPS